MLPPDGLGARRMDRLASCIQCLLQWCAMIQFVQRTYPAARVNWPVPPAKVFSPGQAPRRRGESSRRFLIFAWTQTRLTRAGYGFSWEIRLAGVHRARGEALLWAEQRWLFFHPTDYAGSWLIATDAEDWPRRPLQCRHGNRPPFMLTHCRRRSMWVWDLTG